MKIMMIIVILSVVCINFLKAASFDIGDLAKSVTKAAVSAKMLDVNFITDVQEIDSFTGTLNKELILKMETLSDLTKLKRKSSIVFVKDFSSLENIGYFKFSGENFDVEGKILVVVETSSEDRDVNTVKMFDNFWQNHIANINLLLLEDKQIEMLTFMPFNNGTCHNVDPQVINNFVNDTWESEQIFPNKFQNFNKCPIKLLSFILPPCVNDNENGEYSGYEIELVRLIAQMMNATLIVEVSKEAFGWGFLHENGSAGGVLKSTLEGKTDIAIGNYYLTSARARYLSFCVYFREKVVLTIPSGIPLNTFEKLLSPYARDTWAVLIITLAASLMLIGIAKRQRRQIRNFIFGKNTGNPYLNFIEVILFGSQVRLPKTNFSRTMLMYFILFCIVMRTLYQSGLFKFLQSDQRHPQVQTMDEIVEQKFEVFMHESFTELSKGLKIHPLRKYVGNQTMLYFTLKTLNPYNRIATVGPLTDILYDNQKNYKNFTFKILPEILLAVPVAMYFPKNHFIVNEISSRINNIESAGLKNYFISKYLFVVKEDVSTPLVKLNLDHLSGGFVLYLGGCIFGIATLLLEISIKYLIDVLI